MALLGAGRPRAATPGRRGATEDPIAGRLEGAAGTATATLRGRPASVLRADVVANASAAFGPTALGNRAFQSTSVTGTEA